MRPSARARVTKDLARRRRREHGPTLTLAEIVTTEGITGKTVRVHRVVRRYLLTQDRPDGPPGEYQVSRETWEAFALPNLRTEADRALEEHLIAAARQRAG